MTFLNMHWGAERQILLQSTTLEPTLRIKSLKIWENYTEVLNCLAYIYTLV